MSGLFGRVISMIFDKLLVETLANSKTFQRFALRIDANITKSKAKTQELLKEGEVLLKQNAGKLTEKATEKSGFDFATFVKTFQEELKKETGTLTSSGNKVGQVSSSSSSSTSTATRRK
jgi:hypothetical protein